MQSSSTTAEHRLDQNIVSSQNMNHGNPRGDSLTSSTVPSVDQQFRNCRYVFYKWWLVARMILSITGEYVVIKNFIASTKDMKQFSLRFHMLEATHMFALLVIFLGCTTVGFGMLRKHLQVTRIGTNIFSLHLLTSPIMLPVLFFSSLTKAEEEAASFSTGFLYIFYFFVPTINFTGAVSVERILESAKEAPFLGRDSGILTLDPTKAEYQQDSENDELMGQIQSSTMKLEKDLRTRHDILYKWWLRFAIVLCVQLGFLSLIGMLYSKNYEINTFVFLCILVILITGCVDLLVFFHVKCFKRLERAIFAFGLALVGFVLHYFYQIVSADANLFNLGSLYAVYFSNSATLIQGLLTVFEYTIPVFCMIRAVQMKLSLKKQNSVDRPPEFSIDYE